MNNNRLTIVNRRNKRRAINNILLIIIIITLLVIGIIIIKNALDHKSVDDTITTTTTTEEINTQEVTTKEQITNVINDYTKNFIYNYDLTKDGYKIYVCSEEANARITSYSIYYKNNKLGDADSTKGILVDKDVIDLSKVPTLTLEIVNKKYNMKYNNKCN